MVADRSEGTIMRQPRDKIFITCAVTGNLTTPDQTPHLPITPERIADAAPARRKQALVDAVLLGGIYTLMASGLALSLGITRVINFAHGESIMLGAYGASTRRSKYPANHAGDLSLSMPSAINLRARSTASAG